MKTLVAIFLLAGSAWGDAPQVLRYGFEGPKSFLAGGTQIYQIASKWTFSFTCDAGTDICITSDHTPEEDELVTATSSDMLPGGMYTVVQWRWPAYSICNVSGNTFQLKEFTCSGALVDITSAGTGTHFLHLLTTRPVFLNSTSGFPSGSTLVWQVQGPGQACNTVPASSGGKFFKISSAGYMWDGEWCLKLTVPSAAAPGAYSPEVMFCENSAGTNCTTFSFDLTVIAPADYIVTPSNPGSVPPIPGLAAWETLMTSGAGGGDTWCDRDEIDPIAAVQNLAECPDASVCYYDGTRTYVRIAEYTGDAAYLNCARALNYFYRQYVAENNGQIPTQRIFPEGMTLTAGIPLDGHWDGRGRDAVMRLQNSTNLTFGFMPRVGEDRANAYALRYCAATRYYWQTSGGAYCQDFLNGVITQALFYTESSGAAGYQSFVLGLMAEALIDYWELVSHDQRIPYVIRRMADSIWANYNQTTHVWTYNTGANLGPYCTSVALWFQSDTGGNCQSYSAAKLMHLFAPAFAWYWKYSGDDTYLVRGDDLFEHATVEPTAKEFAEMFRWSFSYVKWRSLR